MRRGTKHSSISLLKPSPRNSFVRDYHNRGKYFLGCTYLFQKILGVSPHERLINHLPVSEVHPVAAPPFLWTQADLTALIHPAAPVQEQQQPGDEGRSLAADFASLPS